MSCITIKEVQDILPAGVVLTDDQIEFAIEAAGCTVEDLAECDSSLSSTRLAKIQTYLAAHYAAVSDNTLTVESEKDGCSDSSVKYGFKFGEGVKGTPFGQMANTLSKGCLAELDKPAPGMHSIGSC